MAWEVLVTEEFAAWYENMTAHEQESVRKKVDLLGEVGTGLGRPHSGTIRGSRHAMRELVIQHAGKPYRILYCFDPERRVILLLGGNKAGNPRWYQENVPRADALFDAYLVQRKTNHEADQEET